MLLPFQRSAVPAAFLFVLTACLGGGRDAGIGVAAGFNVVRVPAAEREAGPSFSGRTLAEGEGEPVSEAALDGRVSVVNFWGSWCGPCRREQPVFNALWKRYEPRGVVFMGVNVRDAKANALAYRDEFGVPYPSVFDPDASVTFPFRVRVMPSTFVLDSQGRIAARIVGALRDESDLTGVLDAELEAAGRTSPAPP